MTPDVHAPAAEGREDVEAHDRVLSFAVERATIVPMRFGVVMDSDEHVRATLLERHADEIAALLEHVEGRVQMSVKAFYQGESLLREVLRGNPELKRRSDALRDRPAEVTQNERIGLGQDVARAVEAQRAADERLLAEPLGTVADEVQVLPPA